MTAGDVGVQIVCNAGGYNLTGATCTLLAAPGPPERPGTAETFGPMTVSGDGSTATYTTTGTDFVSGGNWNLQLRVVVGNNTFTSPAGTLFVNSLV